MYNFNEKTVRNASHTKLANGDKIRLDYYPYKAIRVRLKDVKSINSMKNLTGGDGIYDGAVINDTSIRTWEEARARANAELKAYSNPIISADFTTEKD